MTEQKRVPTPEEWTAARAAWEADPTLSFATLATRLGVSKAGVHKRSQRDGWERPTDLKAVAKKAHTHADRLQATEMVAAGVTVHRETVPSTETAPSTVDDEPSSTAVDVAVNPPKKEASSTLVKKDQPMAPAPDPALVEKLAVDLRAGVTKRHRDEWTVARNLSYEAIRTKDFEKAKLAKITSETLKIIQDGERKAWGLDVPEGNGNAVVVIERNGAGG